MWLICAISLYAQPDSSLTSTGQLDIFEISQSLKYMGMTSRSAASQISFRYRPADSATGVTRETAKRLADRLGVDETQAIHLALHDMAVKLLPQYAADDGPLTTAQLAALKKRAPQGKARSIRSSLFELA
jgi:hypothetical protein